ncbi:Ig domain-containing protein [Methylobacterium aquaticum]|uniref:Ig domain-containing protein n=1 Tax=Methylobacterium aquaticum TaxID=270351 RepID=UPI001931E05D|nr:Ig domain-containing protein [Methylobacterium aquaticum]QRE78295.1 hypothetical protein F1D61_33265 [Methylobacterium aquaticum]QRE78325.1 hypothetical protein F1D61_33455 [Methylobacterium aquaticum]
MDDVTISSTDRVELNWPGKHEKVRVFQTDEGLWDKEPVSHKASLRGLEKLKFFPGSIPAEASILLSGQRHDALSSLTRSLGPVFRFIYMDLPRLNVDDVATAFQSASSLRLTTWLNVVRNFLVEVRELLSRDGVVAVHCGEDESQYARIILDELFRDKRVATIMWQKAYSAQNMPGMKSFTDTHDLIYVYARDRDALPAVGLRRPPKGYANADHDPRGAWKAEHKGAKTRRENSDFDTFQPPYRWKIVKGELPAGLWRLSPYTGVIWGVPTVAGTFKFTAEVTDMLGKSSTKDFSITVKSAGEPSPPGDIPWIFEEVSPKGKLRIITDKLPDAVADKTYSTIIFADGGIPLKVQKLGLVPDDTGILRKPR